MTATPAIEAQSATTTRSTVNTATAAAPSALGTTAPAATPAPVPTTPLIPTATLAPTGPVASSEASREASPHGTRPTWEQLVEAVRETGQYPTSEKAAHVTRIVLAALGGHVVGDERVELAQRLPETAGRLIASQLPVTQPLTAAQFVDRIATRIDGATPATARWDVSSVLSALPRFVDDALIDRVLAELPSGYALLFGRPQLLPAG
ncbi:hypothetical protein GCM10010368_22570 [Streptomyces roseiscleroticus]|nr:DUF2267 domain-containing protein [Streptomyces ruber]